MVRRYASLAALIALLVICNAGFAVSHGRAHLTWVLVGYAGLYAVYGLAKLGVRDIGLERAYLGKGLKYGAVALLVIFSVFLAVYLLDGNAFKDPRYHHSLGSDALSALLVIPLQTVFFEELAFRGILPAILRRIKNAQWFVVLISSIGFGLWHITSATAIGDYRVTSAIIVPGGVIIAATSVVTALAGAALCMLRYRSTSLVAPIVTHWSINAFALFFAYLSWR
jgi:membrane protease YdiL (CAAX protease family)